MSIGLALIAKNEQDTLPRLLASVERSFDQVVLLDTGSTDRTVEIFEEWSAAEKLRQPEFVSTLGHFEWCDDFAAARNAADALLETDWLSWADADDWIVGAEKLRNVIAIAEGEDMKAFQFNYERLGNPGLNMRIRLLRAGAGRWQGRLHEGHDLHGLRTKDELGQPPEDGIGVIRWRTERGGGRESSFRRNTEILRRWIDEEPENPVPLRMLAPMELVRGDVERGCALAEMLRALNGREIDHGELIEARREISDLRRALDRAPGDSPALRRFLGEHVERLVGVPASEWSRTCDSVRGELQTDCKRTPPN